MREAKIVRRRVSSSTCDSLLCEKSQRRATRVFVRLPASIRISSPHGQHVVFVRDISPLGMFFYSDFKPNTGEPISFVLQYRHGGKRAKLYLSGSVVRVEQAMPSSAVGIAVEFDRKHDEVPRAPIPHRWLKNEQTPTIKARKPEEECEVLIQERGTLTPRWVQHYAYDHVPKLGEKFSMESRKFVVMEKQDLLLKRGEKAVRGVLLIVEDFDALSW